MQAVSIVGFKNSGKTTLTLDLIRELKSRGHRVAAVKFSHHALEKSHTDTARFAQDCACVAGIGPDETTLSWNAARPLQDVLPLLGADIVLVEGGKSLTWLPRIAVLGSADEDETILDRGLALASWGKGSLPGVRPGQSVAELAALIEERAFTLPGLDCGACGRESCLNLAQDIVARRAAPGDCVAMHPKLRIQVNGQPLSFNPFIDRLVNATLRGLLGELKGCTPDQRIEITLD